MATITINDTWQITSDQFTWSIRRQFGKKKKIWRTLYYYPTLEQCLDALPEKAVMLSDAEGWEETRALLARTRNDILEALDA